jgi:uncharacterized protein
MRIFLDANTLFSDAKSDGAIRKLINQLRGFDHQLVVDGYVVTEARRNLADKFPDGVEWLDNRLEDIHFSEFGHIGLKDELRDLLPEKDQPVLAAALQLQCDFLVTGDRTHFGPLFGRQFDGVKICSPRQLAETLIPP